MGQPVNLVILMVVVLVIWILRFAELLQYALYQLIKDVYLIVLHAKAIIH